MDSVVDAVDLPAPIHKHRNILISHAENNDYTVVAQVTDHALHVTSKQIRQKIIYFPNIICDAIIYKPNDSNNCVVLCLL